MIRKNALHLSLGIALVTTMIAPRGGAAPARGLAEDNEASTTVVHAERVGLADVDLRRDVASNEINALSNLPVAKRAKADSSGAIDRVRAEIPGGSDGLAVDLLGSAQPKQLVNLSGQLTAPASGSAEAIARAYLLEHRDLWALSRRDVRNLRLIAFDPDQTTGITYLGFQQTIQGVPVFQGVVNVAVTAKGEISSVTAGEMVASARLAVATALDENAAVSRAFEHVGVEIDANALHVSLAKRDDSVPSVVAGYDHFENPIDPSLNDVLVSRAIANVNGAPVVGYHAFVEKGDSEWYEVFVDGTTGELVLRTNLYHDAQGTVHTKSPLEGLTSTSSRNAPTLQTFPDAWWTSSQSKTLTTGNNCDAYLDRTGSANVPDTTTSTGVQNGRGFSASSNFTFAWNESVSPTTNDATTQNQAHALATLFYLNNAVHDFTQSLGFDEASRNFQLQNSSGQGAGNDYVQAEAQDGSGTNNANFATPPDGQRPRMQMYLFTSPASRDGDIDGDVVVHEFGHGVSNRLVASGQTGVLGGTQSGAMGEGWSDYFACTYYNNGTMGEWVTNNLSSGIRRAKYIAESEGTRPSVNDSYADVGSGGFEVHNDGEVWCQALWDLRQSLSGTWNGRPVTDKLVVDGLKLTSANPSMLVARNAIIQADQNLTGGANKCAIWTVFARHGMGYGASGNDGTTHVASSTLPPECGGTACSSGNSAIGDGSPASGALASTDCTTTAGNNSAGAYYDLYTFSGTAGSSVTITLNSTAFDCYVRLKSGTTTLASDDDSNGGTNSKIVYTLTTTGTFTIEATSYSPGSTGSYTITRTGGGSGGGGTPTTVLSEGAESGATGWTVSTNITGNNWVISPAGLHAGANGFRTNQAAASYPNNLNQSLISPAFSLAGKTSASLSYWYKQQTESGYDYFKVEVSTDGGTTWQTTALSNTSGSSSGFSTSNGVGMTQKTISLNSFAGQSNVRLRFRLTSDTSVVYWGVGLDDVSVVAQ